jgi:hypothetical protein
MKTEAVTQDAASKLCEVSFENQSLYEAKCVNVCSDVLGYVVDAAEQKDASSCLVCLYESIEDPSWQGIAAAQETCYEECNTLGGYQFFFSFYVSPPQWSCK